MRYENKIQKFRRLAGLEQDEAAKALGIAISTYRNYEYGYREPKSEMLISMAQLFDCTVNDLLGLSERQVSVPTSRIVPMTQKAPLYGTIAAGVPREMWTLESELPVPSELISKYPDSFFLRVEGNSMNKLIPDGSYALIVPTENVQNGDTVAVNINGYDATLKQWYKTNNSLILSPCSYDSEFEDLVYRDGDEGNPIVRVLGVMVWFMGDFK